MKPYAPTQFFKNKPPKVSDIKTVQYPDSQNQVELLPFNKFKLLTGNCQAARDLIVKGKNQQLGHYEGFCLLSWVKLFETGIKRFCKTVIGWAEDNQQIHQIHEFVKAEYAPYTCAKAQELGVCKHNNFEYCMRGRFYNGEYKGPNPIRFAYGAVNTGQRFRNRIAIIRGGNNG